MSKLEITTMVLDGLCKWAKVDRPYENMNGDKQYSIDVEISDEKLKELYQMGLSERTKPKVDEVTGKKYISIKKPALSREGKEMIAPEVFDDKGQKFDDLIGNGSKVRTIIDAIPYKNKFGSGVVLRLRAVQVLDLVKYERGAGLKQYLIVNNTNTAQQLDDDEDLL